MKRFLLILMALILVAVVSCNPDANINGGGSGGGAKIALDKEAGKEALIEQGSKPSGGSKAIDHTGFVIKGRWTYTENDNDEKMFIALGGKDNFYWIGVNGEDGLESSAQYFYFYDSDSAKYYYDDEDSRWIDITSLTSSGLSLRAMMGSLADAFIYGAYIHDGYLTKGASYAVLGRPCTKYSWAGSYHGVRLSMDFYVDDEYGVTLKQEFHGESLEEVVGFNFEMLGGTKFSGVEVSDLPAGRPADIDPTD